MGMMKGNMAMMVPQTLIMGWINAFFAGFVVCKSSELLCHAGLHCSGSVIAWEHYLDPSIDKLRLTFNEVKLPFPLTLRFKSMLQSGVATRDLDVRWVSSLSWYFLNLFGLQSVFIFILGNDNGKNLLHSQSILMPMNTS